MRKPKLSIAAAVRLYAEGKSISEVAKAMSWTTHALRKALLNAGVVLRVARAKNVRHLESSAPYLVAIKVVMIPPEPPCPVLWVDPELEHDLMQSHRKQTFGPRPWDDNTNETYAEWFAASPVEPWAIVWSTEERSLTQSILYEDGNRAWRRSRWRYE